jgi:hypothetical protein
MVHHHVVTRETWEASDLVKMMNPNLALEGLVLILLPDSVTGVNQIRITQTTSNLPLMQIIPKITMIASISRDLELEMEYLQVLKILIIIIILTMPIMIIRREVLGCPFPFTLVIPITITVAATIHASLLIPLPTTTITMPTVIPRMS